ncbi:MAG: PKD domain-containing protein, partial [Halobaculum sp.]
MSQGSTASFGVDAYDPNGEIRTYRWSFGATGKNVTRSFDGSGAREVTFSVHLIDDEGKTTTLQKTVLVEGSSERNSLPIVKMTGDTVLRSGERATFTLHGRDPDGRVVQYVWRKPRNATGSTLNETFTKPGNYTVRAAAKDDDGGLTWVTKRVRVLPNQSSTDEPPVVSVTGPKTAPVGSTQTYEVEATDPDGGTVVVTWSPTATTGSTELHPGRTTGPSDSTVASIPLTGTVGSVTTVTATVIDDEGNEVTVQRQTRLTAITREAPDQDERPTVGAFGIEYDPDAPTQTGD